MQLAAGAGLRHADVVGLNVAVGDALLIEVVDRLDQFLAEALQEVERQAGFFADTVGQRLFAGLAHQQRGATIDRERALPLDDVRVPEFRERFALGGNAVI